MAFETYLIPIINRMNDLLAKSESDFGRASDYLLEAAVMGCRTLRQLSGDPQVSSIIEEFADVRIIKGFLEKASEEYRRREAQKAEEFRRIIEDPEQFDNFLNLEREVLIKAGVSADVADRLIDSSRESVKEVQERAKPPAEIIETIRLLRDRACLLSDDLIRRAKEEQRWEGIREGIKKIMLGLGGLGLIGLNASSFAASHGMTTVGSVVSSALGGAIIGSAAADLVKAKGAAQ
jgi:hypothetical protein